MHCPFGAVYQTSIGFELGLNTPMVEHLHALLKTRQHRIPQHRAHKCFFNFTLSIVKKQSIGSVKRTDAYTVATVGMPSYPTTYAFMLVNRLCPPDKARVYSW